MRQERGRRVTPEALHSHLFEHILDPWFTRSVREDGGFHQNFAHDWSPMPSEGWGLVFQGRHLWTAATAARTQGDPDGRLRRIADHGLAMILGPLRDKAHGGFFWSLDAEGQPKPGHKHAYGIAFALYGLAAHARAFPDGGAKEHALEAFHWFDRHAFDADLGGYFECLAVDGTPFRELEPGESPLGWPGARSLNSHLHITEALAELAQATGDPLVCKRLEGLLRLLREKLIVPVSRDGAILHELFSHDWTPLPAPANYGHSVETGMVMALAARALGQPVDFDLMQALLRQSLRAAGRNGALAASGTALRADRGPWIWWVQAELLLPRALLACDRPDALEADWQETWRWIDRHMVDHENTGWHPWLNADLSAPGSPKSDFWTEPYHQARAVIGAASVAETGSMASLTL
jgi:mannobiose 2-epimerase